MKRFGACLPEWSRLTRIGCEVKKSGLPRKTPERPARADIRSTFDSLLLPY